MAEKVFIVRHTKVSLRSATMARMRRATQSLRLHDQARRKALLWRLALAATLSAALAAAILLK